jgi:hypothetical protein
MEAWLGIANHSSSCMQLRTPSEVLPWPHGAAESWPCRWGPVLRRPRPADGDHTWSLNLCIATWVRERQRCTQTAPDAAPQPHGRRMGCRQRAAKAVCKGKLHAAWKPHGAAKNGRWFCMAAA